MRNFFLIALVVSQYSLASAFLDLCQNSANADTRITIRAIEESIMENSQEGGYNCTDVMARLNTFRSLDLRGKGIVDLRPLSGLHNLEALYLSDNNIKDLWALRDLPKLVLLDLRSNSICDIGALPDFTELQIVLLDNNAIKNILPIKDLFKLEKVSLENNPIFNALEFEKCEEIKGLIESLIFFRSRCTIENYALLDFNDIDEVAILLNDMAARGDLSYFRALKNSEDRFYVFDNHELWRLLDLSTKKIIIAISHSQRLTDFLIKNFLERICLYREDIALVIENERARVERAIQYFIMDPAGTYPFSLNDEKPLQHLFTFYAQKMGIAKENQIVPVLRVLFSPRFVTRELEEWGRTSSSYPLCVVSGTCRLK